MSTFQIKDLIIYPIKGIQGISIDSIKALERGLNYDRRMMLVDKKGTFISQRSYSQLVHFHAEQSTKGFIIHYKDQSLNIYFEKEKLDREIQVTVFEDSMVAYRIDESYDEWFSEILGDEVFLVYMSENDKRVKELKRGIKENTNVSFADGYPILILGTASMTKLNKNLNTEVTPRRFRPNIIIETEEPHCEDYWDIITINDCKLQNIKPCARCNVITIDQFSGNINKEALKQISTYRTIKNKVYFGTNAIILKEGTINKGDQAVIHSSQEELVF